MVKKQVKKNIKKSSKKSLMKRLKKQRGGGKMMKDIIKKVRKEIRTEKQLEKIMEESIIFEVEMKGKIQEEIKEINADIKRAKQIGKEKKYKALSKKKVEKLEEQKKMLKKFLANLNKGGRRKGQRGGAKISKKDLEKFSKIVELEEYEGDAEDDYGLELYDELVEQGKGYDICRKKIGKRYIYSTFNNKNADGFIASIKGEIVGFIIYYKRKDHLYLDLVCTGKNEKTKGIPLGQILIMKMEEYARNQRIKKLKADAVPTAIMFYLRNGWVSTGKTEDGKTEIIKVLKRAPPRRRTLKESIARVKKIQAAKKAAKKMAAKKAPAKKKGFFAKLFGSK